MASASAVQRGCLGSRSREYRALESGDAAITADLWERMVALYGWPT
jgi:hypothetical protein